MKPQHPAGPRSALRLERLESRDAPATLVSGTRLTYQDADGDDVTVTFSRAVLFPANVDTVFTFDVGSVSGSNAAKQQLIKIDLTGAAALAAGVNITTSAAVSKVHGGDGFAALAEIDATGVDLGTVNIDGDLGRVLAGDVVPTTTGLRGLSVQSLGLYGSLAGGAGLASSVEGRLDSLRVNSDVSWASVTARGIGSVFIGGSLIGAALPDTGRINSTGELGVVTILGDVLGGGDARSGSVTAAGSMAGVRVGGSVRGAGTQSGRFYCAGDMGAVSIGGSLIGRDLESGQVVCGGRLAGIRIGGSLQGGLNDYSGRVASAGDMGPAWVGGNVVGGAGLLSGSVESGGKLAGVRIGGSLQGGSGPVSGRIAAGGAMGSVTIQGGVAGGAGFRSGEVSASGNLAGLTIGGSVTGGGGNTSGNIECLRVLGPVTIGGDLAGAAGAGSANIGAGYQCAGLTIRGSVIGGSGSSSARIVSGGDTGPIAIQGSLLGGAGNASGNVFIYGKLAALTVSGSVIGGSNNFSGQITSNGDVGAITIGGDLVGGSAAGGAIESGFIHAKRIANMTLGGSVFAGTGMNNGAIRTDNDIGALLIRGNVFGFSFNPVVFSARGQAAPTATSDVAIGRLTVLGRVSFAQIIAGVDANGTPRNADAQIGQVFVGGDWISSNLTAGARAGADTLFGTSDDSKLSGGSVRDLPSIGSRIAGVTVAGQAFGSPLPWQHFGIVAEEVGAVRIGGTPLVLSLGPHTDNQLIGLMPNFRVREV